MSDNHKQKYYEQQITLHGHMIRIRPASVRNFTGMCPSCGNSIHLNEIEVLVLSSMDKMEDKEDIEEIVITCDPRAICGHCQSRMIGLDIFRLPGSTPKGE
jgi:hypothetical protein